MPPLCAAAGSIQPWPGWATEARPWPPPVLQLEDPIKALVLSQGQGCFVTTGSRNRERKGESDESLRKGRNSRLRGRSLRSRKTHTHLPPATLLRKACSSKKTSERGGWPWQPAARIFPAFLPGPHPDTWGPSRKPLWCGGWGGKSRVSVHPQHPGPALTAKVVHSLRTNTAFVEESRKPLSLSLK